MKKPGWVDFKTVKESVSMEQILGHYGFKLRRINETRRRGPCPLPTHKPEQGSADFSVDMIKNVWACQSTSCVEARGGHKGGNILDLVAAMEGCTVREAAVKLSTWFRLGASASNRGGTEPPKSAKTEPRVPDKEQEGSEIGDGGENPVLRFTLKGIDSRHPYLRDRGIEERTAEMFGIGFFPGRGLMQGRVVIPIRNERAELVAYAGRAVDGSEPKYKLPPGFKKSVLFNLDRAKESSPPCLIVVEGFFDCLRVWSAGFHNVVALMGSTLTEAQEKVLVTHAKRVVLLLDGDAAGRAGAAEIAGRLVRHCFTRAIELAEGEQPDQLENEALKEILEHI